MPRSRCDPDAEAGGESLQARAAGGEEASQEAAFAQLFDSGSPTFSARVDSFEDFG
jgi:hypothetical protein